jgi:cell division protein WhiA
MTFTTRLKEEISKNDSYNIDDIYTLVSFIKYNSKIDNSITITVENASVCRYIYKLIKEFFHIRPQIVIRNQKRFRVKQIYIIIINDKIDYIKNYINNNLPDNNEEIIAYLKGAFLASGTVSNPSTSRYHLEFITSNISDSKYIEKLLSTFRINAKHIKRGYKYVTYIKASEQISDIIKMFKAINSLFEFEDVRIYRDHKNMVNRLNNCEIANQEKTISTGMKQYNEIMFLKDNGLYNLLDEKAKVVGDYRLKYPESSYQELAEIISLETDYKIGKSGINHNFIKIRELIKKYNKNRNNIDEDN